MPLVCRFRASDHALLFRHSNMLLGKLSQTPPHHGLGGLRPTSPDGIGERISTSRLFSPLRMGMGSLGNYLGRRPPGSMRQTRRWFMFDIRCRSLPTRRLGAPRARSRRIHRVHCDAVASAPFSGIHSSVGALHQVCQVIARAECGHPDTDGRGH
jgi:hypothetical protein